MANAPISIRLDALTTSRLQAASSRAGSPLATYAATLIKVGLSGGPSPAQVDDDEPDESPLAREVFQLLEGTLVADSDFRLEAALALTRIAGEGGTAGVAAIRELSAIIAESLARDDSDELSDMLSTPEFTAQPEGTP
jgi:hypothetical protein